MIVDVLFYLNIIFVFTLSVIFAYQLVFLIIGIFTKPTLFKTSSKNHRYAFVIAARNEESVIGNLIESILQQDYPKELIDIFVVADNCTDKTSLVASQKGAIVYERENKLEIGKGYALDFIFGKIEKNYGLQTYDAFFIFDADNVLSNNYVTEMNKAFDSEEDILTSYRNSKNWHKNWLTAGYGLNFMRECRFLHHPRMMVNSSSFVSGTGFLVRSSIIQKHSGWKCRLLTEDIEFSLLALIEGYRVGYCDSAVFYDEQPETFKASWYQRLRWCKGFYQCFYQYGLDLFKGIFSSKNNFSFFDIFFWLSPLPIIAFTWGIAYNLILLSVYLVNDDLDAKSWLQMSLKLNLIFSFVGTWFLATLVVISERKRIGGNFWQMLKAIFTFPLFLMTYIPLGFVALFKQVTWIKIEHTCAMSIEDVQSSVLDLELD